MTIFTFKMIDPNHWKEEICKKSILRSAKFVLVVFEKLGCAEAIMRDVEDTTTTETPLSWAIPALLRFPLKRK